MKRICSLILTAALGLGSPLALATGNHDHTPRHGGVVVETKVGDVEIVAQPTHIHLYISDHGKVVSLDGASARVTLLNGQEKTEVQLAPAGNRLEAQGSFKVGKGTKGVAVLSLAGKSATTARFVIK